MLEAALKDEGFAHQLYKQTLRNSVSGKAFQTIQHHVHTLGNGNNVELVSTFRRTTLKKEVPWESWKILLEEWSKNSGERDEDQNVLDERDWFGWARDAVEQSDAVSLKKLCTWHPDFAIKYWLLSCEEASVADDEDQRVIEAIGKTVSGSQKLSKKAFFRMQCGGFNWESAWTQLLPETKIKVRARLEKGELIKKVGEAKKASAQIFGVL